ncbi:beta strand repeat-containing protein, partial [Pseudophaeobacter leonis]|uniref:beta strand repeat-containing protein n=1 Tax=Pseudophaeobacter leonis TaxID=1144477 RepID=UPI0009F3C66B
YTVTATAVGGSSPANTFALTNTVGAAATLAVSGGGGQTATVSTAFGAALEALVTDAGGNPVSGITVNFAAPGAGASAVLSAASAVTNASGVASVTATANATAGGYSVTASSAGLANASFGLTNAAVSSGSLAVSTGDGQSTAVSTAFGTAIAVLVTNGSGNPASGVTVSFSAPGAGASAVLSAPSAVSNASGIASVTATANTTVGSYTVTASAAGRADASFALTNTVGVAANIVVSSGDGQSATVSDGFGTALAALVTDAAGNPMANGTVSFAAPGAGASAVLSAATAVSDAAGIAAVTATANATAGSYTVTASATGLATGASFGLTNSAGAAAGFAVSTGDGQTAAISTEFGAALTALVTDAGGYPVSGVTVSFAAPGSGASAVLSASSAVSNAAGIASVTATANATLGSYTVTARASGFADVNFALTNSAGVAASLALSTGDSQSTEISTSFDTALAALVTDAAGNPVPGVTVSFAAPGAGASAELSAATAVTNAAGIAKVTASANATVGSYTVTARVSGLVEVSYALTNSAGAPANIAVRRGDSQTAEIVAAFDTALAALVADAGGNPVSGVTVTFVAPASGASAVLSASTAVTNAAGVARVQATANDELGSYTVSASAAGLADVTYALTNKIGAAARLKRRRGDGQSTTILTEFDKALAVRVVDAGGNPVRGVTVRFSAPQSGASAQLSQETAVSNRAGIAKVRATANETGGGYTVTASVTGVTGVADLAFTLTNIDVEAPTVTLTTSATSVTPGENFDVTATFSEPVIGFSLEDVVVENGRAVALAGAGAVYTITIRPSEGGTIGVAIAGGVANDDSGNSNGASGMLSIQTEDAVETSRIISQFINTRATQLISNQPDLTGFLSGLGGGHANLAVTRGRGNFDISTNFGSRVWSRLQGAVSTEGTSDSIYVFGAIGSHFTINENLIVGGMLEFDYLDQDDGVANVKGKGWLIGPYFVTKFPDRDVFVEGRLLYGQSANDVSPFGTYTDRVDTERLLAQVKVSGSMLYGKTTWIPNLQLTYTSDEQEAYRDSAGNLIPSQGIAWGQLKAGLDFEKPIAMRRGNGELLLTGGLSAIGSSSRYSGSAVSTLSDVQGGRARAEIGLSYAFGDMGVFQVETFYDGIGMSNYESYGLQFGLDLAF